MSARDRQRGVTLMELLIAMSILGVITTMILLSWFALGDSYSTTVTSNKQREYARDAMSRMSREIRDLESPAWLPGAAAIQYASANDLRFYTTFNSAGNEDPDAPAKLVRYRLLNGDLVRQIDMPPLGTWQSTDPQRVLTKNVVNVAEGEPLFTYTYINSVGQPYRATYVSRSRTKDILAVDLALLVDLNPGDSPVYVDLRTTVQPRNLRRT